MNDNIEFDPTSKNVPLWQSMKKTAITEINEISGLASDTQKFSTFTHVLGNFGPTAIYGYEAMNTIIEYSADPTIRNFMSSMGGITGGALIPRIGEGLVMGEGSASLMVGALGMSEVIIPVVSLIGLGTAGFFAGKALSGLTYDIGNSIETKVEKWHQGFKN